MITKLNQSKYLKRMIPFHRMRKHCLILEEDFKNFKLNEMGRQKLYSTQPVALHPVNQYREYETHNTGWQKYS